MWEMYFIGVLYSFVGFLLGYWVFRSHVSLIMVAFTAMVSVPFIHKAIENEEIKDAQNVPYFTRHRKVITMFTFLFLGFVTVFFILFLVLPETTVSHVFTVQIDAISSVRESVTGGFTTGLSTFLAILGNNLKVLVFCIIFSLFYGMGAIFILSWNASVMGAAIGAAIREGMAQGANSFTVISTSLLGYFIHGIPEIAAYFVAGLAGGILSFAVIKEELGSKAFWRVSSDSLHLLGTAIILLIIAGVIEVTITPLIL